jgi:hypothetical protein
MPENVLARLPAVVVPSPRGEVVLTGVPVARIRPGCPHKRAAVLLSMAWHGRPWWRRTGKRPSLALPPCPTAGTSGGCRCAEGSPLPFALPDRMTPALPGVAA